MKARRRRSRRLHKRRILGVLLQLAIFAVPACSTSRASSYRDPEGHGGRAPRIAIAPVTLSPQLQQRRSESPAAAVDAAIHVGHYLAEALLEQGFQVVTAEDSENLIGGSVRSPEFHHDASALARVAVERLGVDGLLLVEVTDWTPRAESGVGRTPAEVGFRATLHGGASGGLLWSGAFSERQHSFLDSPWRAVGYPGRGARWLSANELARWGARRVAAEIAIIPFPQ